MDGLDKVLTELKAQGRNLNQLTTLANMGKSTMVYGDRLAEGHAQISEQLCQLLRGGSKGAPARAQRSGSCGERTSSGVNEACLLRQAERYAACEDDAAVGFNYPPNLKAVACRFGPLHAVPLLPEQRYPPRLVSFCNSLAISMPPPASASCFALCPNNPVVFQ